MGKSWNIPRFDVYDPSLVLYAPLWRPDMGGSPIRSKDRNNHELTVTGATWGYQGRTFDGVDDYIDATDIAQADGITELSVEFWFNADVVEANKGLVAKYTSAGGRSWQIDTAGTSNTVRFSVMVDGVAKVVELASAFSAATWYHIVCVKDSANGLLYLNGSQDGTTVAAVGTIDATAAPVWIGTYYSTTEAFDGLVGEVRIYNRALTVQEIMQNYNVTKWRYQ